MKLIRTVSLLAVWPCVLCVALVKVITSVSLIFINQIAAIWNPLAQPNHRNPS